MFVARSHHHLMIVTLIHSYQTFLRGFALSGLQSDMKSRGNGETSSIMSHAPQSY